MKTIFTSLKKNQKFSPVLFCQAIAMVLLLMVGLTKEGYGQDKARTYATEEEFHGQALLGLLLPGTIVNAGNAVDQNPKTHSTLSVTAGVLNQMLATQFLDFEKTIPAGTPVTVKLTLPASTLGLVDNFRIQPYTNLNYGGGVLGLGDHWRADAAGTEFQGANLLNLLSGNGSVEFTVEPTADFEGIWIEVGSVVGLGVNMDVFHAYILEDATLGCDEKDEAIDVLSGVRAGTVVGGIANATGSVTNPWRVIDGDLNTYATINTGAEVLSEVFHTTIFQTASRPNQVAKVVFQNPGGGLLDLSLLNGLTVQPYLGSTPVGDPINESTLLSLRLLPGASDIYELIVPVAGSFDRIEIKMGGVLGALQNLRIYEVSRLPELPLVNGLNGDGEFLTCLGSPAILTATAPNGNNINWYTTPEGGTPVTGGTFTTPPITGPVTYYVASQPVGCTAESPRVPVKVVVNPYPVISIEGPLVYTLPMGSTFNLPAAVAENADGSNATIVWKDPSGGTISGSSITLPNTIGTYTYRAEATGNDASACTNFKTITITTYDPNTCPEVYLRQYATSETHTTSNLLGLVQLGQVNNPDRAKDGGIKSYSELIEPVNILSLFGETTQTLSWVSSVAAGTPVTLKLAKDYSAASVLGGLFVVGVDASGNEIGPRLQAAPQIAAVVNGVNVFEYTFIPADGNAVAQPYKGVKVILSAVADVLQTARVYDAYYHNVVDKFATCPTDPVLDIYGGYVLPIDGLNAASGLVNVENPEYAIDGDPTHYANMINGVGALVYSKLDVTFSSPALYGDTLNIRLDRPGAPLLDLSVLSGIRIQRFLGNKAVGEPILNTSTLLTLNLLGGGSSQANLALVADQPFDRIQILYGGVASALQNLHVYDIHVTPNTSITGEEKDGDGNNTGRIEICEGETLTLPETDCAKLVLYTDAGGSTQVNLDDIKTLAPGTYTYYIQAQRFGCDVMGDRRPITVVIKESSASLITGIDVAGITDNCIDPAGNVTLTAQLSTTPADVTYQWYSDNAGTPVLMTGETANALTLSAVAVGTHTYYVSITANGYCPAVPTPVTFTVNPLGTDDDINLSNTIFQCIGLDVILAPTSTTVTNPTFRWYKDAAKTTPILDGDVDGAVTYAVDAATGVLTITGLTDTDSPYQYYVTVSGDNACENAVAKEIEVTVGSTPLAPTFVAAEVTLCGPGDAVFEVNNSAGGVTYEVFTDTAGTLPASDYTVSGTTITIKSVTTAATYYVKASGACASGDLGEINIVVNALVPPANIAVSGTGPICAGSPTTLTANLSGITVTDPVFHWYSDASLATEVHTGTTFNVAPLTTTDYYVTVSGDGYCENLADAKVVTVTVNPVPQITLSGSPTIGVFVGDTFTLPTATVDPTTATITYEEITGGTTVPVADPSLPITKPIGTYTYLVTASTGTCESSVTITVSVVDPAECPPGFNRIYNNAQSFDTSILGSISNETNASDQNPSTYSVLTEGINLLGLLGDNYQDLEWTGDLIPAGTPVTVKLGKDFNLVALAGGIRVVGINVANGEIGTPILVDGNLVSALGGNNNFEYTFTPAQDYKAVRVYVNGLVSVGQNARIYGAYYHQAIDATHPVVCEEEDVRDVITGIEPVLLGGLVDVATSLVNVTAPRNAIDNDLNSYAELKNNAGVDAYAKLDIAFATPSLNGDTLQLIAGIPSGGLLDVALLDGLTIQRYLGNVPVGAPLVASSSTLEVNLLPGSSERNLIIYAPVDGAFDRIKILYGGVADVALLSGKALRIYDVSRKAPTKINGSDPDNSITICEGSTISFPPATCNTTYRIYDAITGGNLIAEGPDFDGIKSLEGGVYTFYIQPVRQGCESMDRTAFELTVNAAPVAPVVENAEVCQTTGDVDVAYKVTALAGHTLTFYADATTTTALTTVPVANSAVEGTTTVYVSQINNTTGCEGERVAVSITVKAVPAPILTEIEQVFCEIDSATVANLNTAGATGDVIWYSVATGGTPLATTAELADGTYYAAQTGDECESLLRTEVTVTITKTPPPALTETEQTFCEIDSATVANLNTDGATGDVIWYSVATGGTPLATTAELADGTYYAAQTGNSCESALRTEVTVTITKTPPPALTETEQTFCEIDSATVANLNTDGATGDVIWYSVAAGGTPLATIAALTDGTYYAAQIGANCESILRTEVTVTITKTPPPALTETEQTFCEIDSATVANLNTDGATGDVIWYSVATGGTPLATTVALTDGTYYAAQTGNNCESVLRTEVTVTITKTPPPALTETEQTFCEIDSATVANLNTDGATGDVIWYSVATGGTPLATTAELADGTYYAAQTGNSCESVLRTEVTVTITKTPPPALTETEQTFCEIDSATVANLNTDGATGDVIWYSVATGGTPLATTVALTDGTYYAAQTGNSCESVLRTEVTVTITKTPPPALTELEQVFCEIDSATVAYLNTDGATGDVIWYSVATGGTPLVTTAALTDGTYYAAQTGNSCESVLRREVTVTITKTPAPTIADAAPEFCETDSMTLNDLQVVGTDIKWYASATSTEVLPVTTLLKNGVTYYASQMGDACESASRLAVTPVVNDCSSLLTITKVADEARVKAGESTNFTLTITNTGPGALHSGDVIKLTERPSTGLTITGYSVTSGNGTVAGIGNTATVTTNTMIAVGGTITMKVTGDVDEDAPATITNGITVWGPDKDPGTDPEDDKDDTPDIPVDRESNLSITKVADDARVTAGGSTSFTVTVTNDGPSAIASGEVISLGERPSTGLTVTGYTVTSGNGTAAGTGNSAELTTSVVIPVGGTITLTVTADVDENAPATVANGIDVWGPDKDPGTDPKDDGSDTPDIPVDRESNLSITKVADDARVTAGESTSFTVTVTNDGPSAIASGEIISLGERPSTGLTITKYEVTSGNGTAAGTGNSAEVTTSAVIPAGGTITLTVTADVAVNAPATVANGIDVWGPDKDPGTDPKDDGSDTPDIPVDRESNLSITKKADQARVKAGESTSFTLTITNNGPSEIASGKVINLTERPGTGVAITGYEVTSGNGTAAGTGNKATVTTNAAIAVGGTIVVKVNADVAANAPSTITNGITVWGPDKDPGTDPEDDKDDTPPIPVDRESALSITKKADQARVKAGENTTFTLTITNNGPSEIASGKVINLVERPGTGVSISGYSVTSGNGTIAGTGNMAKVTTNKVIAVGGTIVVKVTAKVDADAPATITNGISVWGPDKPSTDDPDDKDDTPPIPVDRESVLSITKVADEDRVKAGESTTFTVTITNNGPAAIAKAKVINLTERPGEGVTITGYEVTSGNGTAAGTGNAATVTTNGVIAVGGTITVKITADIAVNAPPTITNGISVWGPDKPTTEDPDDEDDTPEIPVDYQAPNAVDDRAETKSGIPVVIDVLANDEEVKWKIDPTTVEIVDQPNNGGTVSVSIDGSVSYTSKRGYEGSDSFTYRVKDENGNWSNTAAVAMTVLPNPLEFPNVFTPNGDGLNDVFEIKGLDQYPENELMILNRWGNQVFFKENYTNDWTGDNLTEGTYYYILRVKNASNEWDTYKGPIALIRVTK